MEPLYQLTSSKDPAGKRSESASGRKHSPEPLGTPIRPADSITRFWVYRNKAKAVLLKLMTLSYSTHVWWSINRELMGMFLPEALLQRYRPYRQGDCNRCGACCKILFQCPFLGEDEGGYYCKIYETPYAMWSCKKFPMTPADLNEVSRRIGGPQNCTFSFEGQPDPLTFSEAVTLSFRGMRQAYRRRHSKQPVGSTPANS